jgi:cell division septal protein FtsQ
VGLISALFILFTQIVRLPQMRVDVVHVSGTEVVSKETLEYDAAEILSGMYGKFLFPKRFVLFLPRAGIREKFLQNLRIESLSLNVEHVHTLQIVVSEREAKGLWCSEQKVDCFLLDALGLAYAEAPHFTGNGTLPVFFERGDAARFPKLGDSVYESEKFEALQGFIIMLQKEIEPRIVQINLEGDAFTVLLEGGQELRFLFADGYSLQLQNVIDTLNAEVLQGDDGVLWDSITFIDFRFGNKVYFKTSEDEE